MSRRPLKSDKFFLLPARSRGPHKGKRALGVNRIYEGDTTAITVQDLFDFLKKEAIAPSDITLQAGFTAWIKEK